MLDGLETTLSAGVGGVTAVATAALAIGAVIMLYKVVRRIF